MLNELPTIVTIEQNEEMTKIPDIQEVKDAVMGLNRTNAGGPMA